MIKEFFKRFELIDWVVFFCSFGSIILAIPDKNVTAGLGWFCALLWFISSKMNEFMRKDCETEIKGLETELKISRIKKQL